MSQAAATRADFQDDPDHHGSDDGDKKKSKRPASAYYPCIDHSTERNKFLEERVTQFEHSSLTINPQILLSANNVSEHGSKLT
jgi:hypothetical protein